MFCRCLDTVAVNHVKIGDCARERFDRIRGSTGSTQSATPRANLRSIHHALHIPSSTSESCHPPHERGRGSFQTAEIHQTHSTSVTLVLAFGPISIHPYTSYTSDMAHNKLGKRDEGPIIGQEDM